MKLVYQIAGMGRAKEIMRVLGEAGMESTLQGEHTWSIRHPDFRNPLPVWIMTDADEPHANEILECYFAREVSRHPHRAIANTNATAGITWLLLALGTGPLLAIGTSD